MFLTSLAAFQMMNVNPCISTVSVAAAEEREEIRSWKAKVCFFLPLRWKSKVLLLYLSPASRGFPAFSERCSGERCSRFPSCWWKEEKKSPKLMNFAGSGPQWVLVAALCRAVCCFPYQCAGALGTDCWQGIKKLPDKLFFCWKKQHRRLKTLLLRFWHLFSKERRLFLSHWASYSWFAMKESRTQFLPLLLPSVGFVPAADIEETSQLWASFSMNIDLLQEERMDSRKKSLSSGCCRFQCDVAGVFTALHHREMKFPQLCMKMHICHCCLSSNGKQAGKLKQGAGWKEEEQHSHKPGVQWALFFFLPLHESKFVLPPEPACNPVPDAVPGFVFPSHPMIL